MNYSDAVVIFVGLVLAYCVYRYLRRSETLPGWSDDADAPPEATVSGAPRSPDGLGDLGLRDTASRYRRRRIPVLWFAGIALPGFVLAYRARFEPQDPRWTIIGVVMVLGGLLVALFASRCPRCGAPLLSRLLMMRVHGLGFPPRDAGPDPAACPTCRDRLR